MTLSAEKRPSTAASVVFDLLDPIAFGFFVAAMIFDIVYADGGDIFWMKSAAWLISFGLLFAVLPRLINLARVWLPNGSSRASAERLSFWLNLVAIVAEIVNAFVHSRDAYGVMPEGMWLSILTVVLIVSARLVLTTQRAGAMA